MLPFAKFSVKNSPIPHAMSAPDLATLRINRGQEDRGRPGGRRVLLWILAAAAVIVTGIIVWRADFVPRAAPEVRVSRPRVMQPGGAEEVLTATGYIVPQLKSVVSARTSGRLEWLGVEEGSRVEKGQIIARLEGDDLAAQVLEAKASLAQSRASLEQARAAVFQAERELERQKKLLSQGITTASDHDLARRSFDVEQAGLNAASEAIHVAEARVTLTEAVHDKTIVRAPFAGIVISKSAEIGEMVAAGAFSGQPTGGAIVTIADFSTMEMEADINESNLAKIRTGQPALVSVDAVPGRQYRGELRQIVPTADRQKAVVMAKVRLVDIDESLVPDMSARVSFLSGEISAEEASGRPRIFVPASSVVTAEGRSFVLVLSEDRVSRVPVELGETRGDLREVTAGLQGGEKLIVSGGEGLRDGDKVRAAS